MQKAKYFRAVDGWTGQPLVFSTSKNKKGGKSRRKSPVSKKISCFE